MAAAAPLSKPVNKKPIKRSATPSMLQSHQSHRGKRPRPSDSSDLEPPATTIRKKDLPGSPLGQSSATTMLAGELKPALRKGMYLAFIDDAFSQRLKGNNERYQELLAQFRALLPNAAHQSTSASTSTLPPTSAQLRIWLDALTHVVSKLDKTHTPLVETILAIPWATLDDHFVNAYVRFIGSLVSTKAEWLRSVLEKCVKGFKYRSNYTTNSPASMPSITRRILYGRLHTLLRMLLSLIPTLAPSLSPLLTQNFPSKREPRSAQICYIDNLLVLTEYCPALSEDILSLVIERALNIDVEIQGEPEEWEDAEEEMLEKDQNGHLGVKDVVDRPTAEDEDEDSSDDEDEPLDLDDLDSDDEPNPVGDEEAARRKGNKGMSADTIRKVLENRGKLDAILKVILDHLAVVHSNTPAVTHVDPTAPRTTTTTSADTTPTPEQPASPEIVARRLALFRTVLDIFDRTLLRTFKTRNTQFLIFYLCSLDVSSSDHFIGVLLGRALFEADAPAVTRVAAAGYVASFVSRAVFVDASMTRKVVRLLCQYLEGQMDGGSGASQQHLPVFYAAAQAVFYIFCFRWKDLLDEADDDDIVDSGGRRWMMGLETVKKAVASSFNPLKVCAQPVVNQFATIAHKTNFLYCYAILDTNRRIASREQPPIPSAPLRSVSETSLTRPRLPSVLSNPSLTAAQPVPRQLLVAEEMDSFFPFDPFKLPLSSVYIDDIYREWTADDESASEEASSDSDADDDSSSASEADTETEEGDFAPRSGGLAVPGSMASREEEDDVARSFEAMSLSPDRQAFGGRLSSSYGRMPSIHI